jgi:Zn-dependent alcohol dehydrogenase
MISASAVVIEAGDRPCAIGGAPLDRPGEDQIVVRMGVIGSCHSDAVARNPELADKSPAFTGHETASVVEWIGSDVPGVEVGDHVVPGGLTAADFGVGSDGLAALPAAKAAGKQLIPVVEGDAAPRTPTPHLIQLWRDGRFPFDRMVEKFPFAEIDEAERASSEGRVVKPVPVVD